MQTLSSEKKADTLAAFPILSPPAHFLSLSLSSHESGLYPGLYQSEFFLIESLRYITSFDMTIVYYFSWIDFITHYLFFCIKIRTINYQK